MKGQKNDSPGSRDMSDGEGEAGGEERKESWRAKGGKGSLVPAGLKSGFV